MTKEEMERKIKSLESAHLLWMCVSGMCLIVIGITLVSMNNVIGVIIDVITKIH